MKITDFVLYDSTVTGEKILYLSHWDEQLTIQQKLLAESERLLACKNPNYLLLDELLSTVRILDANKPELI